MKTDTKRRFRKPILLALSVILAAAFTMTPDLSFAGSTSSAGASIQKASGAGYRVVTAGSKKIRKIGDYYFKTTSENIYYSTSKGSGYEKISGAWSVATDGSSAYYFRDNSSYTLCRLKELSLDTGETDTIKEYSLDDGRVSYDISAARGDYFYWTRWSEKSWSCSTYRFDPENETARLAKKHCSLYQQSGAYALGENKYHSDVSGVPVTLYRLTGSGKLVKVKRLATYSGETCAKIIGNKVYFLRGINRSLTKKASLYKGTLSNGSIRSIRKIRTFKAKSRYSQILVRSFHTRYCKIAVGGRIVKVYYK